MCYTCFLNRASFKTLFHMWCPFLGVVYGGTALCYRVLFIVWCDFQCPAIFATVLVNVLNAGAMKHPRTNKTKAALDTTPPDQQNKPHLKKVICIFLWVKGVYLETIKTFLFIQEISLAYENCMVIACILICLQSSRRLKLGERFV